MNEEKKVFVKDIVEVIIQDEEKKKEEGEKRVKNKEFKFVKN